MELHPSHETLHIMVTEFHRYTATKNTTEYNHRPCDKVLTKSLKGRATIQKPLVWPISTLRSITWYAKHENPNPLSCRWSGFDIRMYRCFYICRDSWAKCHILSIVAICYTMCGLHNGVGSHFTGGIGSDDYYAWLCNTQWIYFIGTVAPRGANCDDSPIFQDDNDSIAYW